MARPSIGSPYFQELAEQAQLRRQSAKHEVLSKNDLKAKSPSPFEVGTHNHMTKSNQLNADDDEFKYMKQKYAIQNKSLAQQNSAMSSKLSDMETKISDLINENMTLRKFKTTQEKDVKEQLDRKMGHIEANILTKFDDILQVLKNIRYEEGLPENSQLDILSEFSRPVTSTPINEIDGAFKNNESSVGTSRRASMRDSTSRASLFLNCLQNDLNQMSHDDATNRVRTKSREFGYRSTPPLLEKGESGSESLSETSNEKANEGMMVLSESKNDSATSSLTTVLPDGIKGSPDVDVLEGSEQDISQLIDTSNKKRLNKVKASKKVTKNTKSPITHKFHLSSEQPGTQEITTKDSSITKSDEHLENATHEIGRRSMRVKKNINYAEPKTGSKIRRESERFVDAVGGYLPRFKVKEETSDGPQVQQQFQASKKRRPNSFDENAQSSQSPDQAETTKKRKPLSNVTNSTNSVNMCNKSYEKKQIKKPSNIKPGLETPSSQKDTQTQVQTQTPVDLSVFDFDDKISGPTPKRSYRRRTSFAKSIY